MGKSKKNNSFRVWEKWFIGISSILIFITVVIYGGRLIYYYMLEHPEEVDNSLSTHIIKNGVVYTGDGLYSFDQNEYYYVGIDVNNYLWYSGRLWRIISVSDQGIKMITDKSQSSLVWSINLGYDNSYIKDWLGKDGVFLKSLGDYDKYLVEGSFCYDKLSLNNVTCNNYKNDYVGLLSVSEYLRAKGRDSYLNNGEYYWLMNSSDGNRAYYVFSEGGINNETSLNETYYSYGVRPVVVLSNDIDYYGGDGTKDSPYQVNMESDDTIGSKSVGEYVIIDNYRFRIQDKFSDSVKLIMDGYVTSKDNNINKKYKSSVSYLTDDFYKTLSKENLVKCDFNKGTYGKKSEYNFRSVFDKKINDYIGMPSVGELFITEYNDYWLYNSFDDNTSLQYKTNNDGRIIADDSNNKNYLRSVICVKSDLVISEGIGFLDSPYMVME